MWRGRRLPAGTPGSMHGAETPTLMRRLVLAAKGQPSRSQDNGKCTHLTKNFTEGAEAMAERRSCHSCRSPHLSEHLASRWP